MCVALEVLMSGTEIPFPEFFLANSLQSHLFICIAQVGHSSTRVKLFLRWVQEGNCGGVERALSCVSKSSALKPDGAYSCVIHDCCLMVLNALK